MASQSLKDIRGKLFHAGARALTDQELWAALFSEPVERLPLGLRAEELAARGGFKALCLTELELLCAPESLGPRRTAVFLAALELARRALSAKEHRPCLKTPGDIHRYLWPQLSQLRREVFHVLCLNPRSVLVRDARIAEGFAHACPVDPKEIFAPALATRATAVVLAHNHPSGDPTPSALDVKLTHQLAEAGRYLGICVLDHLVLGDGTYVSFLERNLLRPTTRLPAGAEAG
jgi:DNA repair protein RadC